MIIHKTRNHIPHELHYVAAARLMRGWLSGPVLNLPEKFIPSISVHTTKGESNIYIMQNKDYVVINNFAAFIYRSLLLVN